MSSIRVGTWNIACAAAPRYRCHHLDKMVGVLKKAGCDILLFQEVDKNKERTQYRDITALFAEGLEMHAFFAPAIKDDSGAYGNAVLSRQELLDVSSVALGPDLGDGDSEHEPRSAACATVKINNIDIRVFSTHLANSYGKPSAIRREQIRALKNHLELSSTILGGGDFNVVLNLSDLDVLREVVKPLCPDIGPTCSLDEEESLSLAIDHIYGRGLAAIHSEKHSFPELSDHCLVIADVMAI